MSEAAHLTPNRPFEVSPLSGSFGGEVRGVDLGQLSDTLFDAVYDALVEHQVLVFRDQKLTPEQYLAFAKRWGGIHQHPFMKDLEGYPGILEIVKTENDVKAFGNGWHSDQMFVEKPAKCTMLHAKEVPERGGDTMFSNMYAAYDGLSDGMKALVHELKGWNSGDRAKLRARKNDVVRNSGTPSEMAERQPPSDMQTETAHPLVRLHKDSRRKALYLGGHTMKLDGFTNEESAPILGYLKAHSAMPEYTCRVNWEVNSLTIWDNRCVQHYAVNDYQGMRRRMHRITIAGDEVPVSG